MKRAELTPLSERLTPGEVARLWFRRTSDFAGRIHEVYRDFPAKAPDGLYLRESVAEWFRRWHGIPLNRGGTVQDAEQQALEIARNGGGQNSSPVA